MFGGVLVSDGCVYLCWCVKVLDINMIPTEEISDDFSRTIRKQKEVPGYNARNYRCCRIYAPSNTVRGGSDSESVMIPISLVFHKSLVERPREGGGEAKAGGLPRQAPVLMSGYGE